MKKDAAMLEIGAKVPLVEAFDDEGRLVKLENLIGKPFVLWFYPRASTPG